MKRSILAAAVASAVVLTGCGGGGDTADEDAKAKGAISAYLMQQQRSAGMMDLKEQEADCIADGMVDGVGVDQLKEYGLLKEDGTVDKKADAPDLSKGDSEVVVDSMFDCTDVMATMKEQLGQAMGGAGAETTKCVQDALTREVVRDILVASFSGEQQQAQQELMGPMTKCLAPGGSGDKPDQKSGGGSGGGGS